MDWLTEDSLLKWEVQSPLWWNMQVGEGQKNVPHRLMVQAL